MIMETYAAESAMLRVQKLAAMKGQENTGIYRDILDVFMHDAAFIMLKKGTDALQSFAQGDRLKELEEALRRLTHTAPVNVKEARRRIAARMIEDNSYRL